MAQPVGNQGLVVNINPDIAEGNLRTDIKAFLATINLALTQSNAQDRTSVAIRDWRHRFFGRISAPTNLRDAQNEFILELQIILLDPIEQRDRALRTTIELPLLGNDGITYGTKSLCVALSQLPEPLQCRSPIHLEAQAIFFIEPHPIAGHAVRWLQGRGACIASPLLDADYQRLLALNQLPEVPTKDSPKVIQFLEHQARRNLRLARERELIARQALEQQQPSVNPVPVDDHVYALNHNPNLMDGALRREIRGFLVEVKRVLDASNLRDPVTVELRNWQRRFSERVGEHADVRNAQNEFILALQDILLDPIEHIKTPDAKTTLDAPLLGSDGITYGTKSLSICLSLLPEAFKRRSPIHFQDEAVFTTQPHPVAEYLIRWLKGKNAHIVSAQVEADFQQLIDANRLPVIPTAESIAKEDRDRIRRERIRILMEQQAEQNALEAQELAQYEQGLLDRQARIIQENLVEPMNERIQEFAQAQFARVDVLAQNDERRLQPLRVRVEQFHNNIAELEGQNRELRAQLSRLEGAGQELRREAIQLQIEINETRKEIEDRKAGWAESLLKAVAVVGICVFATWAAGAVLPAGMSAAVKPLVGGIGISLSCGAAQQSAGGGKGATRGPGPQNGP